MPPVNPNPVVLETKDRTEKELENYFANYFSAVDRLLFKQDKEQVRIQVEKYKDRVEQLIRLYGQDFYDLIIHTDGRVSNPNYFSSALGIGNQYYTNNLLRVRAASINLENNKALISVPKGKLDKGKNLLDSRTKFDELSAVPYYDLSGPAEPRLQ